MVPTFFLSAVSCVALGAVGAVQTKRASCDHGPIELDLVTRFYCLSNQLFTVGRPTLMVLEFI